MHRDYQAYGRFQLLSIQQRSICTELYEKIIVKPAVCYKNVHHSSLTYGVKLETCLMANTMEFIQITWCILVVKYSSGIGALDNIN